MSEKNRFYNNSRELLAPENKVLDVLEGQDNIRIIKEEYKFNVIEEVKKESH